MLEEKSSGSHSNVRHQLNPRTETMCTAEKETQVCHTSRSVSVIPLPSRSVAEPPNERRSRWRSIYVMYFTMFMSSITFSMTMSTLWPFLKVVDDNASPKLLGWVVASYSIGQLVAAPIFGFWSLKREAREPLICSLILQVGSNLYYAYVQSIPGNGGIYLLTARAAMGFASGNAAVVRAYVSGATTLNERTSAMANVSVFQSIGFIIGPFIQTALVEVAYPGPVEEVYFHFNMYTSPAFLASLMALFNFILVLAVFRLHRISDTFTVSVTANVTNDDSDDVAEDKPTKSDVDSDKGPPDYIAVFSSMYLFFIVFFMFTIFETIATPLAMDMYAWTKKQASLYIGFVLAGGGILAIIVFIITKFLSSKGIDERKLLLSGYILCFCGNFIYLPWGHELPLIAMASILPAVLPTPSPHFSNSTGAFSMDMPSTTITATTFFINIAQNMTTTASNATTNTAAEPEGCPWNYDWCQNIPKVHLWQFLLGTFFMTLGYPICNAMTYSIYSKVLGSRPQGLWMGFITACGSLARTMGPVFVGQVFGAFGPRITFAASSGIILLTIFFNSLVYKRLVPYEDSVYRKKTEQTKNNSSNDPTPVESMELSERKLD